jgi:hypothetical protein
VSSAFLLSLLGGALIGLSATWYWWTTGGVAGISGLVRGAVRDSDGRGDRLAFLAGLIVAGVAAAVTGLAPVATVTRPAGLLLLAGVLVGFGTRVGGGCTSGHGVCGLSRRSARSLVATLTFIATGAATVFVTQHLLPGVVAR